MYMTLNDCLVCAKAGDDWYYRSQKVFFRTLKRIPLKQSAPSLTAFLLCAFIKNDLSPGNSFYTEVTDRVVMDYQTKSIMSILLCKAIHDWQCNGNGKLATDWLPGVKPMERISVFIKIRCLWQSKLNARSFDVVSPNQESLTSCEEFNYLQFLLWMVGEKPPTTKDKDK